MTHTIQIEDKEIILEVTSYYPRVPARLMCLHEDATPEEPEEVEFCISEDSNDSDFLAYILDNCEEFAEKCEQELLEVIHEQ